MTKSWQLKSVGIDIGTTTSQVIFSNLEVINRASASQIPSYEFSKREITYVSEAIATPIDFEGHLHEHQLKQFILAQYANAGINLDEIDSGAIIITGESSKARNARLAIMQLAESLGDFIVATAGPHLESVIAGQGSGAYAYSKTHNARVLNIDIGGGTSNYVVFEAGRIVATACLNVGGHLIELDAFGKIKNLHKPAALIAHALFGEINPTDLSIPRIIEITATMAQLVYESAIGGTHLQELSKALLMSAPLFNEAEYKPYDVVFISGGVGLCFYEKQLPTFDKFNDIGPLLAHCLRNNKEFMQLNLKEPKQTLRATVIGAGAYTLSLSGSTIWLDLNNLPLRNIPVIHALLDDEHADNNINNLADAWQLAGMRMDLDLNQDLYALYLPKSIATSYSSVLECITAITTFAQNNNNSNHPLLILCVQDMGKILGLLLKEYIPNRAFAVIDEIQTHAGDYIDIGQTLKGSEILPVTIKSLAFPS